MGDKPVNMVKFFLTTGWNENLKKDVADNIRNDSHTFSVVVATDDEGNEYMLVKRFNGLGMTHGTAVRADVDDYATAKSISEDMMEFVDNIV